jgi:hypothetical protein
MSIKIFFRAQRDAIWICIPNKEEEMSEAIYIQLRDAIIDFDADKAKEIAQKGIANGLDPVEMINQGIRQGLELMGERFSGGNIFLGADVAAQAQMLHRNPERTAGRDKGKLGKILIAARRRITTSENIVALVMSQPVLKYSTSGSTGRTKTLQEAKI